MSGVSPTPLADLRVVEISDRIAGAYCGKLLVDAGADVVKVEPVGGDPLRRFTATGAVPPDGTFTVCEVPPLTVQFAATPLSTTVWLPAARPENVTVPLSVIGWLAAPSTVAV